VIGLSVFTLGSLAAGLAGSAGALIGAWTADGDLRGEADAVQQVRRAAQGIADVEQPTDQRRDPG